MPEFLSAKSNIRRRVTDPEARHMGYRIGLALAMLSVDFTCLGEIFSTWSVVTKRPMGYPTIVVSYSRGGIPPDGLGKVLNGSPILLCVVVRYPFMLYHSLKTICE